MLSITDKLFLRSFAYAMFFHAEVVSGAYKLRQTQQGVEGGGWRDLTDEEKLQDSLATMKRHLHRMLELEVDT